MTPSDSSPRPGPAPLDAGQPQPQDTAVGRALDAMAMRYVIDSTNASLLLRPGLKMEVLENTERFFVPHAPDWCDGLINLRGELLPVIALGRLLSMDEDTNNSTAPPRYLLVIHPERMAPAAITLRRLPDKIRFTDTTPAPLPDDLPEAFTSAFPAAHRHQGRLLLELDHIALLDALQNGLPATQADSSGTG